ncbi:MAG: hypothetical protein RIG82_08640 [Phycisphaeraceae bacterium]
MEHEPTMISGLVYSLILAYLMDSVERDLALHLMSVQQYAEIADAISRDALVATHKRNLVGEYVLIDQTYRYPVPDGWVVGDLFPYDPPWGRIALRASQLSGVWALNRQRSLTGYLSFASDFEFNEVSMLVFDHDVQTLDPSTWFSSEGIFDAFADSSRQMEMRFAVFKTALACYQYMLQYGRIPETLDELVPQFLPSVPYDDYGLGPPSTGLKLKRHDWGLVVYSRGPDGEDDGGIPVNWDTEQDPASGDIVFRVFEHPGEPQPRADLLPSSQ